MQNYQIKNMEFIRIWKKKLKWNLNDMKALIVIVYIRGIRVYIGIQPCVWSECVLLLTP